MRHTLHKDADASRLTYIALRHIDAFAFSWRYEMNLHLISHALCPYVQRAVIALTEKGVDFRRTDIDLAAKPDWFLRLSPLGKTPVLVVDDTAIFESAVILEYLEETHANPLHPADPVTRAQHRGWIEMASVILNGIAGLYSAKGEEAFMAKVTQLTERFQQVEVVLDAGPWFAGDRFSLVDAAFAPVFRYFDCFDRLGDFGILSDKPKLAAWRAALAARPSVINAVGRDYPERLMGFLAARDSDLARLVRVPA
jgi:glutathione S-transferase